MSAVSEAQLEEVRLERDHVQAQLHSAQQQIESCRTAMQVHRYINVYLTLPDDLISFGNDMIVY